MQEICGEIRFTENVWSENKLKLRWVCDRAEWICYGRCTRSEQTFVISQFRSIHRGFILHQPTAGSMDVLGWHRHNMASPCIFSGMSMYQQSYLHVPAMICPCTSNDISMYQQSYLHVPAIISPCTNCLYMYCIFIYQRCSVSFQTLTTDSSN